jgi:hypothetical protein
MECPADMKYTIPVSFPLSFANPIVKGKHGVAIDKNVFTARLNRRNDN